MYRNKSLYLQGVTKRMDDRSYMETLSVDDLSLTLSEKNQNKIKTLNVPELCYELPAFWPLVIHLELVENRERFAAFVRGRIILHVRYVDWWRMNHCRLEIYLLMLCTASSKNRSGDSLAVLVVLIRRVVMLTLRAGSAKGFLLLFFRKFKVALNPFHRFFLNFAKSCILSC